MALTITPQTIQRGAERVFSIVEMRRAGSGLAPTGVEFKWSTENRAAPRGQFTFGVQLRTRRRDLPGSEVPAEQVLGWNYTPFQISGIWDDRYGGDGFAGQTWRDFEKLVQRGNLVKIQFEQFAVTGLITVANFTYKLKSLMGYSFTVSPHVRYDGQTVREEINAKRRVTVDPRTAVYRTQQALIDLQSAQARARAASLSRVQQLLKNDSFSEIGALIDNVASSIAFVSNLVDNELTKAENAVNTLNRGAQTIASVKTLLSSIITRTGSMTATTSMAINTAVESLQFEAWHRGVAGDARRGVVKADQAEKDFALRARPKPKRVHRARQGESLYAISNTYYGTPHHWREIASFNKLTSIIMAGGELLTIPELKG